MLEIIKPGSKATLHDVVEVVVLSASISADGILYKVAWMDSRTRHEEWVASRELSEALHRQPVGFRPVATE